MWVLAESLGYVIAFNQYQGAKNGCACVANEKNWGLGESVVLSLLGVLLKQVSFSVYFDNFFTSFRLVKHLEDHGFRATGTLNKNKIKCVPIVKPEKLQKEARGHHEVVSTSNNHVTVVGWNDNKPVYICSNNVSLTPSSCVERWDKKKKEFINSPLPAALGAYNKGMGVVDRCDQNISSYMIGIRGKKWWWALFVWVPDMIVQNS